MPLTLPLPTTPETPPCPQVLEDVAHPVECVRASAAEALAALLATDPGQTGAVLTALLDRSGTAQLHNCTTAQLHNFTASQLHNCTLNCSSGTACFLAPLRPPLLYSAIHLAVQVPGEVGAVPPDHGRQRADRPGIPPRHRPLLPPREGPLLPARHPQEPIDSWEPRSGIALALAKLCPYYTPAMVTQVLAHSL